MAVEWGGRNVQANGIAPGYMRTDMTTVLTIDRDGVVAFVERRFDAAGTATGDSAFAFRINHVRPQPA